MHIYLVYLVLDDVLKNVYPYLINPDTVQYNSTGLSVSLYGFTNDKDTIIDFCDTRSKDIFYFKKKKIKKEEYSKFNMKYILYEIDNKKLNGCTRSVAITKFEEMVATDISAYGKNIDEVVSSHRVNIDTKSIEYLNRTELERILDKMYTEYRSHFDVWLKYFAPTIDLKRLYLKMKG